MLSVTYEESYPDSRSMDISQTGFDKTYKFYLCGNFYDEALPDPDYPDLFHLEDENQVLLSLYSVIPVFRYVPLPSGMTARLIIQNISIEQINWNSWVATVNYAMPGSGQDLAGGTFSQDPEANQHTEEYVQIGFNLSAQQETVKTSLSTTVEMSLLTDRHAIPGAFARYNIGETPDGVEGTSIYTRQFGFNITQYFPPSKLTIAYVRRLYRMQTQLNSNPWFNFPAMSVLFLQANGSGDLYNNVPVTFEFEAKPNFKFSQAGPTKYMDPDEDDYENMYDVIKDENFPDSPSLPGTTVHSGWVDVEYRYFEATTDDEKTRFKKPSMRLIHKNYELTDFDKLGL